MRNLSWITDASELLEKNSLIALRDAAETLIHLECTEVAADVKTFYNQCIAVQNMLLQKHNELRNVLEAVERYNTQDNTAIHVQEVANNYIQQINK